MQRSSRKLAVVVTTISNGGFLLDYARAIDRHGGADHVTVYVVGDLNTPSECRLVAERVRADGYDCRYLDVEQQEKFLAPFPALRSGIPYRSDNRRNVGYLLALRDDADVIISVDDDNIPMRESPFFAHHAGVGRTRRLPTLRGAGRWCNVCALLDIRDPAGQPVTVYPRGFPHSMRALEGTPVAGEPVEGVCGVNLGLWTGDPDVDAATRLVTRCSATAKDDRPYFLATGQRTPISSQNSAIVRQAVPAYYYWQMGWATGGMSIDRYGDMFSGYCLALCAEAVGHRISVGPPFVRQARNEHDPFKDLCREIPGMVLIEDLRALLEEPLPAAAHYDEPYLELAERLMRWASRRRGFLWEAELVPYMEQITSLMRAWVQACRALASPVSLRATVQE
jgi:hypothetical protein